MGHTNHAKRVTTPHVTALSRNDYGIGRDRPAERHALEDVRLLAPVRRRKFLAIGLNYADHIAESGMEAPQFPVFFTEQVTCISGPDEVHMPRVSNLLDYEGELAIVIGAHCRHVPAERAPEVIAGLHDRQRPPYATGRCAARP